VREYDADEIKAAFETTLGEDAVEDLVSRRLRDPNGLATTLAVELARSLVPAADVAQGAAAVVCGLLVGSRLPPQEPAVEAHLADALATVRSFGRHAVIARHCDLGAVAEVETAVVGALGSAGAQGGAMFVLFEIGLALGLSARPQA
jgi:hypothetical protein